MKQLFRYLVWVPMLWFGPSCLAQAVTIRVINAHDDTPLQNQHLLVSLHYDTGEKIPANYDPNLALETNSIGEVHFVLPEPVPTHISAQVRLTSASWRCGCVVFVSTEDLIQKGVVGPLPEAKSRKPSGQAKAVPGEILFVARPLSFLERLLQPFVKG